MQNDLSSYYFHQGTNYNAYDYLGCHLKKNGKSYEYTFRVWAPNATCVALISDFTGWNTPVPMRRITENGVWELVYSSSVSLEKKAYKFRITSKSGTVNKGDPYAVFSRGADDGASLIFNSKFRWTDSAWIRHRKKTIVRDGERRLATPINIYELHLGSFLRSDDGTPMPYREIADILAPYVKAMGFTHVELMPIMEHPYDGSWGYQVCGFYAPTSRYGDPDDFRYFINTMHSIGVGVILDWVPAHFPKDEWGLYEFDGSPLYEYQGIVRQESASWGTRFFDLGREEIQSFLVSNALYYLREFHVDGLRVDAVASMLYLDYDRAPGEWIPNKDGSNISLEAVAFFKKLNSEINREFPDILMIAEESGDHGAITRPISDGGLGFTLKWNMGWANDFYEYLSSDPVSRRYKHKALTFPLMYAYSEDYCLPISHDEVVHGKRSLIDKMHGEYEMKFEQMRAAVMLMMTYPGKKLMFMGTEFAQFREWDYASSLEWFMLDYPKHSEMRDYVRSINAFYLESPQLWELDFSRSGFEWIAVDEADKNTVAYRRFSRDKSSLICVINFSGIPQELTIPLREDTRSLDVVFATSPEHTPDSYKALSDVKNPRAAVCVPAFAGVILRENNGKKSIKV